MRATKRSCAPSGPGDRPRGPTVGVRFVPYAARRSYPSPMSPFSRSIVVTNSAIISCTTRRVDFGSFICPTT